MKTKKGAMLQEELMPHECIIPHCCRESTFEPLPLSFLSILFIEFKPSPNLAFSARGLSHGVKVLGWLLAILSFFRAALIASPGALLCASGF
jgi:hypothetical protein